MLLSERFYCAFFILVFVGPIQASDSFGTAPNFSLESSRSESIHLKEQIGNVVMLNFWASWCGPCRQEMPHLEEMYLEYSQSGLTILAISVDEDTGEADRFMGELKVTFPYLYDNKNKVSELYGVEAMPTTILIDRQGRKRFMHKGYQPGFEQKYLREVKLLLRE